MGRDKLYLRMGWVGFDLGGLGNVCWIKRLVSRRFFFFN